VVKDTIVVRNLQKSYGKLKVLKGISFSVKHGTILALLGPNGAGKTTTIKILSTLLRADKGSAKINGYDIVSDSADVRANIGLTGQYAAVDEYLSGKENLELVGRLYRLSRNDAGNRAKELLKQFDLVEASNRTVKTYSGGMKRRLDLAMSLIASPPVIFLDEPTTGLDPRSRMMMWGMIKKLVKGGTTILLTTQYMEEADHLADEIIVLDDGKIIAQGTADSLKAKVGADHLQFTIAARSSFAAATKALASENPEVDKDRRVLSIAITGGVSKLKEVLQKLEKAKIEVEGVSLSRPTLDDVFLSLTGHSASQDNPEETNE
jgi:ABC-2 type transport system ATP-binding protein